MKEDQEQSGGALVPSSSRALTRNSSGLVRRGLDDLLRSAKDSTRLDKKDLDSPPGVPSESDLLEEIRELGGALARGDVTNSLGMDLVRIPEGRFLMGSNRREDERPIHEVTIRRPFYMGQYPVLQRHWRQVMGNNPSTSVGDDKPVHCVSWDDAQEFMRRLNILDGEFQYRDYGLNNRLRYRLPSEAEWEYACRAGITGDVTVDGYFMAIYGDVPRGRSIQPLGRKRPNAFGLHDILVGFKEWCEDRYHVNYYGAPSDGSVWGEVAGEENRVPQMNRVARGSLSGSPPLYKRAAARSWAAPWSRGVISSFRLVAIEKQRESTVRGVGDS